MERSINVCRICLKVIQEDELFYPIINNSIVLQRLNLITFVTIRNLQLTEEPVICETCIERLKEFADFKENIITNEFKIQCHQKKDVNLFLKSVSPNCENICRTCFKSVQKGQNSSKKWKDNKSMFIKCNIHLNLNIARPSVMCETCYNILINMFRFVCNCIENEKRIVEHYGVYEKILEAEDLYCIFNDDKNRIPKEKIENFNENEKNNNKVPVVSKLEFHNEIKSEIEEARKLKNNNEDQNVENEEPQHPKRKTKNEKSSTTTEQPKGRKITRSSTRNHHNKDEGTSPKRRGRQPRNKGKNEIFSKNDEIEAKRQKTIENAAIEYEENISKIEETENNNVEILNKKQTEVIEEHTNHENEDVIVISEDNESRNKKKQNNETITITEEQEENKQENYTQNDVTKISEEKQAKGRKKKCNKRGKNKKNAGKNASKASIEETHHTKKIEEEQEEKIEATSIKRVSPRKEQKEEDDNNKKAQQKKKGRKGRSKIANNTEEKNNEEQKNNQTIDVYNFEEENEIEESYCSKNLKNNEETKRNNEKYGVNQDSVDKPKTRSSKRNFNTVVDPIEEVRSKTPNEDTKPKRKSTKREETQEIDSVKEEEEPKRRRKRGKSSPIQINKTPEEPKPKRTKKYTKNDSEIENIDSPNEFSTQSLIDILEGNEAEENRSNANEKSQETQPQSTRDPDWLLEHRPKPDWMRLNRDKPDFIEHVTEITEHDSHNETILYSCDRCGYKTKSHDILVKHRLVHNVLDTVQKFKCAVCHFQTKSHELLKQHVAIHVRADCADISYGCIHCEHKAKKKVSVLHHTIRHPTFTDSFYCRVVKDDDSPKEENRSLECLQCEFQTTNDVDMKGHLIEHQFQKRSDFTIEMFKCEKCSYKTKQRELLQRHERMHALDSTIKTEVDDDSERFKCEFCTFTGDTKRALLIHIKMKHLGKREPEVKKEEEDGELYYCAECPYVTRRKANMPRHALVHRTRENMEFFECSHCPFETKHKRSYKRHMETIHKINV